MSNTPEDTIRDGRIKATLWRNEGEKGPYVSTDFSRSWQDSEGQWHDSKSFGLGDLLGLSELARTAYGRGREIERDLRDERQQWRDEERNREPEEREREVQADAQVEREERAVEQDHSDALREDAERDQFMSERAAEAGLEHTPEQTHEVPEAAPQSLEPDR